MNIANPFLSEETMQSQSNAISTGPQPPKLQLVASKPKSASRPRPRETTCGWVPEVRHQLLTEMLRGAEPKHAQAKYNVTQPLAIWTWAVRKFQLQEERITELEHAVGLRTPPGGRMRMVA